MMGGERGGLSSRCVPNCSTLEQKSMSTNVVRTGSCVKVDRAICALNKRQIDQADRGIIAGNVLLAERRNIMALLVQNNTVRSGTTLPMSRSVDHTKRVQH